MTINDLIGPIARSVIALREIDHLEIGGRTCVLAMSGHMTESTQEQSVEEYFRQNYDDAIVEFLQMNDYGFCLHHACRTLFYRWQEELASVAHSPLGRVIAECAGSLLIPTKPTREKRSAAADHWYDSVRDSLAHGAIPPPHGQHHGAVVRLEECRAQQLATQRFWFGILISVCELWAEQVVLMWRLLRESIALSVLAKELDEDSARVLVAENSPALENAIEEWNAIYITWHQRHRTTVDIHDPFFRKYLVGLEDFYMSHPEFQHWPISDGTKDEIYMEIASGIAQLKGKPYPIDLPTFTYWRKVPWNPVCLKEGRPGLPPFPSNARHPGDSVWLLRQNAACLHSSNRSRRNRDDTDAAETKESQASSSQNPRAVLQGPKAPKNQNGIELCKVVDIPANGMLRIEHEGLRTPVAVAKVGNDIYCFDDSCPHMGAELSNGYIEKCAVICPKHQSHFNLRTGRQGPPARNPLVVHEIVIQDGSVFLDLRWK